MARAKSDIETTKKIASKVGKGAREFGKGFSSGVKTAGKAAKAGYKMATEEEDRLGKIDEKLNIKKADMGEVIDDFYDSDAPQFKGKSKEKRRQMAIAAKLQADEERACWKTHKKWV